MKKQVIYIIPGFGENIKDTPYPFLINFFLKKGYIVKEYQPKWKYGTINTWIKDFQKILSKENDCKPMVLGFSFGAMIALLEAQNFTFSKIILCSLSPFFKDDLKEVSPIALKILGKNRIKSFKEKEFPIFLKIPAVFIFGSLEKEKFNIDFKIFSNRYTGPKEIFIIPGVGHDISDLKYLEQIKKIF